MFDFNQYSSLLLPGFLQAMVFCMLLGYRGWKEERIADGFAAAILLVGALYVAQWMLGFAGWYDSHDWRTTLMFYISWDHIPALGPLVWLYFRSVTNTDFAWKPAYSWAFALYGFTLLLPLGVFLGDFLFFHLINGESFQDFYGTRGPAAEWLNGDNWYPTNFMYAIIRVFTLFFLIRTLLEYRAYQNYLRTEFSNLELLKLKGLKYLLLILVVGLGLTFLLEAIQILLGTQSYVDVWGQFLAMSVLIFFAAIQFHSITPELTRQLRFTAASMESSEEAATKDVVAPDPLRPERELQIWEEKLARRLDTTQDYLDPDLKLGELARRIGTNSSVLSKVINTMYGKNFNDYINGFRCRAFLDKVAAGEHHRHTLLSLAIDCGFNSKSTFNRAFRKLYGRSPGEVVREQEAKK